MMACQAGSAGGAEVFMLKDGDVALEEDIFNLDLEGGAVGGTGLEAIIGKSLDLDSSWSIF